MSSMFDNAETFLNANSDLFMGLSEADLQIPEKLIFLKGELVEGTILDATIVEKIGAVRLDVKIESGDHTGKLHELTMFKPKERDGKLSPSAKKKWVEFLLAFFSKDEILGGKVDFSKYVGSKFQFVTGEAKEFKGKVYQDYTNYKVIEAFPF